MMPISDRATAAFAQRHLRVDVAGLKGRHQAERDRGRD